ncbi:hypothetical protein U14_05049 [Candidatus Moduliflexus flocculans]|uniref:Uncharacterized protein n=1 Tax=Candidatus Moduliflexus flocculans TaxID=1499966 RepID=A0A081BQU4_9BACT|nr:hypothetical protein U14_05049 [Candidatus Moduliflexus flocculans]
MGRLFHPRQRELELPQRQLLRARRSFLTMMWIIWSFDPLGGLGGDSPPAKKFFLGTTGIRGRKDRGIILAYTYPCRSFKVCLTDSIGRGEPPCSPEPHARCPNHTRDARTTREMPEQQGRHGGLPLPAVVCRKNPLTLLHTRRKLSDTFKVSDSSAHNVLCQYRPMRSSIAVFIASRVRAKSSSECANETNAASNCDGAR